HGGRPKAKSRIAIGQKPMHDGPNARASTRLPFSCLDAQGFGKTTKIGTKQRSPEMRARQFWLSTVAAVGLAALAAAPAQLNAQVRIAIDNDDIGGVVTGPNGPEAGVWVIAETKDLPTRYAKMVVTDDQGRYVVPDLPKGKYQVWVRGYGLVDSPKVAGE